MTVAPLIHIADGQSDELIGDIAPEYIIDDTHRQSLEDMLETFEFYTFGDKPFTQYLKDRNRIIIPDEDGTLREFIIYESEKYRDTEGYKMYVIGTASYLDLKKANVIRPGSFTGTASQHIGIALNDTEWRPGIVEVSGSRTIHRDDFTNPFDYLKTLAREFEGELRFRIEHNGNRITGRFVDLLERIGEWRGREVTFGKDLDGIRRIENTERIVTALVGLGPEREDGTRLEVLVEDDEALQRWGRPDPITGELRHLIEVYEPQSERQEMTEKELRQYTRTELNKRINAVVTYECSVVDLENVPGMENKQIRFGDTIKIKDTKFNPPLYIEARVYEQERSIKSKAKKTIKLGDFVEYTEEEINAIWNQLRNEIRRRLDRMAIVSITSTAGNVFKNAQGETELTARTFVNGAERDEDGTLYDYQWMRFDKNGNHDTDFYAEGKTITVTANDIDEKATYRVLVAYELEVINTAEITISNVFDGEDGEPGPPGPKGDKGEDGKTFYTWIKYADTPTSGMSDNPEGKEYIGIAYNKETPTPSTNYADYVWSKFKGDQGVPGPPGKDGQPTYTWVKYADDEHGNGMSDSPEGKLYIGLAFNKTTPEESNNPADYTWSLMPQNIEIGGRNLIGNSDYRKTPERYNSTVQVISGNPNSVLVTRTGSVGWGVVSDRITTFVSGQVYTLSFELKTSDVTKLTYIHIMDNDEGNVLLPISINITADGQWHKYIVTFTSPVTRSNAGILIGAFYRDTSGDQFELRKLKLELGNKATDWTRAEEDVQAEIDEAKQEAEEAKQDAQTAIITADGKNTIIPSKTEPPTEGRKIGDAWFQEMPDGSLVIHDFNGVEWVKRQFGEQSIIANSITANHIKSLVGLNVNDQFIVDSQGNVKFAGHLEGASGTFGDVTVTDGDFNLQDAVIGTKYSATPRRNLIKDHSFEMVKTDPSSFGPDSIQHNWLDMADNEFYQDSAWYKVGSPKVAFPFAPDHRNALPIFGEKAIVVRNANYVRQYVWEGIGANSQYTVSAHFKRQWNTSPGIPRIEIWHVDTSTNRVSRIVNETFPRVRTDYSVQLNSVTFTVPSSFGAGEMLEVIISGGDNNWVQCDGVQLNEGPRASVYLPEDTIWDMYKGYFLPKSRQIILWVGERYPTDSQAQTIYPDKKLQDCANGWILRWQHYVPGTGTENQQFQYTHIPKAHLSAGARGMRIPLQKAGGENITKYIYVYDDRIQGHASNGQSPNNTIALTGVFEY